MVTWRMRLWDLWVASDTIGKSYSDQLHLREGQLVTKWGVSSTWPGWVLSEDAGIHMKWIQGLQSYLLPWHWGKVLDLEPLSFDLNPASTFCPSHSYAPQQTQPVYPPVDVAVPARVTFALRQWFDQELTRKQILTRSSDWRFMQKALFPLFPAWSVAVLAAACSEEAMSFQTKLHTLGMMGMSDGKAELLHPRGKVFASLWVFCYSNQRLPWLVRGNNKPFPELPGQSWNMCALSGHIVLTCCLICIVCSGSWKLHRKIEMYW